MADTATLAWLRAAIERAQTTDECLVDWPFSRNHKGYPHMKWRGKVRRAHQVVLELVGRPCPPGLQVRHTCGNGHLGCLNERHLTHGSNLENAADRAEHGTEARGAAKPGAKLTEDDVRAIRASEEGIKPLARRFGIDPHTVRRIRRREKWAHVV